MIEELVAEYRGPWKLRALRQDGKGNELQEHRSGWTSEEMRRLGYGVTGLLGHKILRSEGHNLRFPPRFLAGAISFISYLFYARWFPSCSSALLCVKETGR